jgi:hypothetical protein
VILLPSPIPHPLAYCPFDLPDSADKLIESVVGPGWPVGDEAATWDVADRWYAAAEALAGAHSEAFAAATQIMTGGSGDDGFRDAWERLAGDPSAPLNALVEIAGEVGALVEDCGRSLEAAKLSAWIEIGLLLNELTGIALVGPLTFGIASPVTDSMIAATRYAIAHIFSRLASEMGTAPAADPLLLGLCDLYAHGPQRIEAETGATFQNLCPHQGAADPADAKAAVDIALRNLTNHLHNSGHGAYAVVVTDLEGGGHRCWAASNRNGVILFLDPQTGRSSEEAPLYHHRGTASPANVLSMEALVVDGHARPAPLPYHGPSRWTTRPT